MKKIFACKIVSKLLVVISASMLTPVNATPVAVATYDFNDTFSALQSGVAPIQAVNPLNLNQFTSDVVFGQTREVYRFNGNASPSTHQAGLTLDTTGLLPSNVYSLNMIFSLNSGAGSFRRIIDVSNRQSDSGGLYVTPANQLTLYPYAVGGTFSSPGVYHALTLVNSSSSFSAYIDGNLALSTAVTMNINNASNPAKLVNFFLDNTTGANADYSSGKVALINLYAEALTPIDIGTIWNSFPASPVPVPAAVWLMGSGLVGLLGLGGKRPRRATCNCMKSV